MPLDASRACESTREIFHQSRFPELSPAILDVAIASVNTEYRNNRVFFEANKRHLLDDCGHYFLYGSEYIVGIATSITAAVSNGRDYALELKTVRTPTLLECDVPIAWLLDGTVSQLAGTMLVAYFELLLNPNYKHPAVGQGFGFEIFQPLPPCCIVAVSHPRNVRDPIR